LTGGFYIPAAVLFATSIVMAALPTIATALFGVVVCGCFFYYGWKYRARSRVR
jgi:hypothetical protein